MLSAERSEDQRVIDDLRTAIESGKFEVGDRLPGEAALRAKYNVTDQVIRQALKVLSDQGLLENEEGAHAKVTSFRPIKRRSILRLARQQWGTGASIWSADEVRPATINVHIETLNAPDHIARLLELDGDALVCARGRRFQVEGRPVMLATSYLPLTLVEGTALMREDTGSGGMYARLAELGQAPTHFRETVRCRLASAAEAETLDVPVERPIIKLTRTALNVDWRPIEVNEMIMDSAAYILEYDFDA